MTFTFIKVIFSVSFVQVLKTQTCTKGKNHFFQPVVDDHLCFTNRISLQLGTIDGLSAAQISRPIFILCICTRISVHALIKSDSLTNTALIRAMVSDIH